MGKRKQKTTPTKPDTDSALEPGNQVEPTPGAGHDEGIPLQKTESVSVNPQASPAPLDKMDLVLRAIKDLNDKTNVLNENQKTLDGNVKQLGDRYTQLGNAVQQLYRVEASGGQSAPPPGSVEEGPMTIQKVASKVSPNTIIDLIKTIAETVLAPKPTPSNEAQGIFSDKELMAGFKQNMLDKWKIDTELQRVQVESVKLKNTIDAKKAEGEML